MTAQTKQYLSAVIALFLGLQAAVHGYFQGLPVDAAIDWRSLILACLSAIAIVIKDWTTYLAKPPKIEEEVVTEPSRQPPLIPTATKDSTEAKSFTLFDMAQRYIGTKEIAGASSNSHILAMLRLDNDWPDGDEVPWCAAFINHIAWLLRLPRSKSLRARSWLKVGKSIPLGSAIVGNDIVVLKRAGVGQPGADVLDAPGHVGVFAGMRGGSVLILGGNQNDEVNVSPYPIGRVIGVQRIV